MDLPTAKVEIGEPLAKVMVRIGFAKSKGEARRLIEQGAVYLSGGQMSFEAQVDAYVLADRQWPRHLRIQHAEYQRTVAKNDEERRFWRAVLQRNKD